jgi:hypothetical protein
MPRLPRRLAAIVLILAAGPPARADDPKADLGDREKGDLAIRARAILKKYCSECHRENNPDLTTLPVLDHARLTAKAPNPVPFVAPGDAARSQVLQFIEDGSMPPGGRPRPTPDEVATLKKWIDVQAPSYPKAFDDRTTLAVMIADFERLDAKKDAPFARYLSLAHLVVDDDNAPPPDLQSAEKRLRDALHIAAGRRVTAVPVDDTATLFRLDLQTTGWHTPDLFDKVERGKPVGVAPLVPFDLILLEYPLAPALPRNDRLDRFLAATKQVRPIPFLRGDWVADALVTKANESLPLAEDLTALAGLAVELAGPKPNPPCGPLARPFAGVKQPVPGAAGSLPLTAWYAGDCEPDPAPFRLTAEVLNSSGNPVQEIGVGDLFRLRVGSDRDVSFTLLAVLADGTVRVQPVAEGNILKAGESRQLRPDTVKAFQIGSILGGKDMATEHFVLLASEGGAPTAVPVRSQHADGADCRKRGQAPVWRFLVETPDQRPVVRKVVPITVGKQPKKKD